jgi:hypothetical protein
MRHARLRFAPLLLLAALTSGTVLRSQSLPGTANPAESLRRFLAGRGLLSSPGWIFAPDLNQLYSVLARGSAPGCPLGLFRDQPGVASTSSVNVFAVDFKSASGDVCDGAPNPGACSAITNSCAAVGTSVFCDHTFLERRETLAALAYYSASKGLAGIRDGGTATFGPLPRAALTDLAQSTLSAAAHKPSSPDSPITADAKRLARSAPSTVLDLAASVSLLLPVLHEIGHIEQGFCGRGLTPAKEFEDVVASLMFSGEIDWDVQTRLYETLTCSSLARNELAADLRSADMLMRYLEDEAPKAAAEPRFDFSADVDLASRRQLQPLARWSREIAMLSVMYGLEYDVMIYQDPAQGLTLAVGEPPNASALGLAGYYLEAATNRRAPLVRGHLEPGFRSIVLTGALHMERLGLINFGRTAVQSHVRLAPFVLGRMRAINERSCGSEGARKIGGLDGFIRTAMVGPTRAPEIDRSGPGGLDAANQLLARFMAPGANYRALTQSLRPRLEDLRAIFNPPFAERAYEHYSALFDKEAGIQPNPGQTEVLVRADTSDRILQFGGSSTVPGGYSRIARQLRPGLTIYSWKFVKPGQHFGLAFDGLYFVNGRWVLAPKPYRVE